MHKLKPAILGTIDALLLLISVSRPDRSSPDAPQILLIDIPQLSQVLPGHLTGILFVCDIAFDIVLQHCIILIGNIVLFGILMHDGIVLVAQQRRVEFEISLTDLAFFGLVAVLVSVHFDPGPVAGMELLILSMVVHHDHCLIPESQII